MKYETAKQLKDAGFPLDRNWMVKDPEALADIFLPELSPTLSELIEACGDSFYSLIKNKNGRFVAKALGKEIVVDGRDSREKAHKEIGDSVEEAVANLWLKLNKE